MTNKKSGRDIDRARFLFWGLNYGASMVTVFAPILNVHLSALFVQSAEPEAVDCFLGSFTQKYAE